MRVVFMGTPDFAVPSLEALVAAGHAVVRVISQPDRPKGRGQEVASPPVVVRARALGLEVRQPRGVNGGGFRAALEALAPDVAAVVAYGRILPADVLTTPRFGCVNLHASLLPRWRGAAPIQRAVMAGDAVSGVSTQRMEVGLDTGPLYRSRTIALDPRETAATLHDRLASIGAEVLVETLAALEAGLEPTPQGDGATVAPPLGKDDGRIRWDEPAWVSDRRVRGVTPWPGGWVETSAGPLKVRAAHAVPSAGGPPGVVVSVDPLTITTADGALVLDVVQAAGRKPVAGAAYANGARLATGVAL